MDYILRTFRKTKRKTGPKFKITKTDLRHIKTDIALAIEDGRKCSTKDIITNNSLDVSRSTVSRMLKQVNFEYKNIPNKYSLTPTVRRKRIEFEKDSIINGFCWDNVIFSDEKFFTLNGIDSYYCWVESGHSPRRVKQLARSSGFMTWAMIMPNGLSSYKIVKGKLNSHSYINIIKEAQKIWLLNYKGKILFQQDNASCHVSKFTKDFMSQNGIETLV